MMTAYYRPELPHGDHEVAIFEGTDFGYGRKPV